MLRMRMEIWRWALTVHVGTVHIGIMRLEGRFCIRILSARRLFAQIGPHWEAVTTITGGQWPVGIVRVVTRVSHVYII